VVFSRRVFENVGLNLTFLKSVIKWI